MRFLTLSEVPIKDLTTYRVFPLSMGIMLLILSPAIPMLASVGSTNGVLWYLVCVLVLLWLLAANDLRKALHSTAWLVAVGDKHIYLKWRSYQNLHWGTHDVQVLELPFTSIASVREIKRSGQSQDNPEISHSLQINIQLGINTDALAKLLAEERAGRPGGVPIRKSKWGHFPVSLARGNQLRIQWRAWPGITHCIRLLNSRGVDITP